MKVPFIKPVYKLVENLLVCGYHSVFFQKYCFQTNQDMVKVGKIASRSKSDRLNSKTTHWHFQGSHDGGNRSNV